MIITAVMIMTMREKHESAQSPLRVAGRSGAEVSAFALDLGGELAPRLRREREHRARAVLGVADQD